MDILSRLPAELRERVFCCLGTRQDVLNLSSTSRLMFEQAKESRLPILRNLLWCEMPGDILQDAVAIITFPSRNMSKLASIKAKKQHLRHWGCKRLPDILLGSSPSGILALNSLYTTIVSYIEDYLSKALSPDPRFSYVRLPSWAHSSYEKSPLGSEIDRISPNKPFSFPSLSPRERHRLLTAFFRYELICRACSPRPLPMLDLDDDQPDKSDLSRPEEMSWNQLAYQQNGQLAHGKQNVWNWNILAAFESESVQLPWEKDELYCVHEYVRTLYGAMCLRIGSDEWQEYLSWSRRPHTSVQEYFSPSVCSVLRRHGRDYPDYPNLVGFLASFGFDLVHNMIRSPRADLSSTLARLNEEIRIRLPDSQPGNMEINPNMYWSYDNERWDGPLPLQNWEWLRSNIWWLSANSFEYKIFWRAYRQRAWAFLDDLRHYPKGWTFPTRSSWREELLRLRGPNLEELLNLDEYFKTEDELVDDLNEEEEVNDSIPSPPGAFMAGSMEFYPSMEDRMGSFWQ